jgi:transposase InsO family protein
MEQELVKRLVVKVRKKLKRSGTRKVYEKIKPMLEQMKLKVGRDKLFSWMKQYGLLIAPKKRYVQTTMSKHWMKKYPNLIKDMKVTAPEQVWVSDITYIKTEEGNCYLNMITDAYSRKIVGYAVDDNMEAGNMVNAFEMALKGRINKQSTPIHHSDRGSQYCSKEYIAVADRNGIRVSMTENGDPYENALAERMNRTIKEEFGLDIIVKTKELVRRVIEEAILLYNTYRPHLSLKMKTPEEVHQMKIPITS